MGSFFGGDGVPGVHHQRTTRSSIGVWKAPPLDHCKRQTLISSSNEHGRRGRHRDRETRARGGRRRRQNEKTSGFPCRHQYHQHHLHLVTNSVKKSTFFLPMSLARQDPAGCVERQDLGCCVTWSLRP